MRLLALNQKGITHYIVPMVAIVLFAVVGTVYLVKSHAATAGHNCTAYQYAYGGSGQCVKDIQTLLNSYRTSTIMSIQPKLLVDGQFGTNTKSRVISFQKASYSINGVNFPAITADGVVGKNTWHKLCYLFKYAPKDDYVNESVDHAAYNDANCINVSGVWY